MPDGLTTGELQAHKLKENLKMPDKLDLDKVHVLEKDKKDRTPLGISPMVKMTEKKWREIEVRIGEIIDTVIADRNAFVDKLTSYQEAIDGIPERGRTPPWAGACKLRDTLTSTHCRIIENAITRTLTSEPYYIAKIKGNPETAMVLQGLMNDSCKEDFNFETVVNEISKSAVRKTVGIMVPEWERRVKVERDIQHFTTIEAYKDYFGNAKDAGLSEQKYQSQLEIVKKDIDEFGVHECLYEYDSVIINRPVVHTVKPEDLIMHPFTSPRIELAQLVMRRMGKTFNDLVMMWRDGQYWNVDRIWKKSTSSDAVEGKNDITEIQLQNKGVQIGVEANSVRDKIFTIYKGIYRTDVDDTGIEKDYEVVYAYEKDSNLRVMLRFAHYGINYNERNFIAVSILPEQGTIFGGCIPELLENPQATLDTLIRLLIDSNSIANVPVFVANHGDKDLIERSRDKGKIFPGRFFWVKQTSGFSALRADRIDANAFLSIIRYIAHISEMASGASQTLAGQNLPDDPQAPGVKTAMLLQRSDIFINSYLKNMRPGFGKLAKFIIKLYRQHLKHGETRDINIVNEKNAIEKRTITRDDIVFLDEITSFELKNQKVEDNQQVRQVMALRDAEILLAIPQIGENPMAVRAVIIIYLTSTGRYTLDQINEIAPTQEQIQQMFRNVANDVLASERAGQQQQLLQQSNQQMIDQNESDIDKQIRL